MTHDTYPIACLIQRLFDVVLFIIAVGCLMLAVFIGVFIDHPEGENSYWTWYGCSNN